jgi:hypothetical protein
MLLLMPKKFYEIDLGGGGGGGGNFFKNNR